MKQTIDTEKENDWTTKVNNNDIASSVESDFNYKNSCNFRQLFAETNSILYIRFKLRWY